MMKYTPRVRSEIAPIATAASAATATASGHAIQRAADAFHRQHADRVRADAEERRVAQAHHPAVAEDEVQAGRGDREDHDAPGQLM